jgi:hypothetical protein
MRSRSSRGRFGFSGRGKRNGFEQTSRSARKDTWIFELESLDSSELVIELEDNLKAFQHVINKQHAKGSSLKLMSSIVRLLTRLAECGIDAKEAANRVLAECLHHERCYGFHTQLRSSVLSVLDANNKHCSNFLLMLAHLCSLLLDQYQWDAYSVLPISDIQRVLNKFAGSSSTNTEKFLKAVEDLQVRIENIQISEFSSNVDNEEEEDAGYTYRLTSILPDFEELTSGEDPDIPCNIVKGKYQSWNHYYDTQFHLLREDFVQPLRHGICDYYKGFRGRDLQDIRVYRDVRVLQPWCTKEGVSYVVKFDASRFHYVKWDRTKRLMYGSLVCLLADFSDTVILASVVRRETEEITQGLICLKPEGNEEFIPWNHYNTYTMIESSAYFEAYRHILRSLQNAEIGTMPFKQYLIDVKWDCVDKPAYIQNYVSKHETSPSYDLTSALGCKDLGSAVNVVYPDSWPHYSDTQLDSSQMEAMKMALTQEIALIQGPPGTGKTYIGIKIVDALCRNRNVWDPDCSSPILVVCYTNHALDQFLNGIKDIEVGTYDSYESIRIARVGSRGDANMDKYVLRNIRRGKIPNAEYYKLRKLQDTVKEEEKALTARLQSLQPSSGYIQSFQDLARFMGATHLQQLQEVCPGEPPDVALKVWLGLMTKVDVPQQTQDGEIHGDSEDDTEQIQMDSRQEPLMERGSSNLHLKAENPNEDNQKETRPSDDSMVQQVPDMEYSHVNVVDNGTSHAKDLVQQDLHGDGELVITTEVLNDGGSVDSNESSKGDSDVETLVEVENEQAIEEDRRRLYVGDQEESNKLNVDALLASSGSMPTIKGNMNQWLPVENYQGLVTEVLRTLPLAPSDVQKIANINTLDMQQRWGLYAHWVSTMQSSDIQAQIHEYNALCQECHAYDQTQDQHVLESVHVIGMTTTGAAKYQHILHLIKPKIVIIEEAAEVLESHIVSCLTASTQHLILIGDHQQLRPKPNVYELATKCNLDISLFERLVRNDFPRVTLEIQHRMRPEIAQLVHPLIYPVLENHSTVCNYDNVKGVCSNLYFVEHCELEKANDELKSHSNIHEAQFVAALCSYLIQQGYKPNQITILCAYTGQLLEVRRYLPTSRFSGICIRTLDNYQGEENDIVLLTLVRSNELHKIGFLKAAHRVCVALSRAKMGFYCIGNFRILEAEADIWRNLLPSLRKRGIIGPSLRLCCQNHPNTVTDVSKWGDFANVPEGGCLQDCSTRLNCGHSCVRKCHHDDTDHSQYKCAKNCPKVCELGHPCKQLCYRCSKCPPCKVTVPKTMPQCGHTLHMRCHQSPEEVKCTILVERICPKNHVVNCLCHRKHDPCKERVDVELPCGHTQIAACFKSDDPTAITCRSPCARLLECGHQCTNKCYETCSTCCTVKVEKERECGHILLTECGLDVNNRPCHHPCTKSLLCGHKCQSTCSSPCNVECKQLVDVTLPCGHQCTTICSCPGDIECKKRVEVTLPCGHNYWKECSSSDNICLEQVSHELKCGHIGNMPCSKDPLEFKCNKKRINYTLPCGHTASSVFCHKVDSFACKTKVKITRSCGHTIEVPCAKQEESLPPCNVQCFQILACGHPCQGDCAKCFRGRLHQICSLSISLNLPCGHTLRDVECFEQHYVECKAKCPYACGHKKELEGQHKCTSQECFTHVLCQEPCSTSCVHQETCEKKCSEQCGEFPFCGQHCPKILECKHPCEGMCGEPCPKMCRRCQQTRGKRGKKKTKQTAKLTFLTQLGHEVDLSKPGLHFVQLRCGHIFEVGFLDAFMTKEEYPRRVEVKNCPKCHNYILNMQRYRDITKSTWQSLYAVAQVQTAKFRPPRRSITPSINYRSIELETDGTGPEVYVRAQSYYDTISTRHTFSVIHYLVRDFKDFRSSYDSDAQSPYRGLPRRLVLEVFEGMKNVREFCKIMGSASLSHQITPQNVHDWIKEVWRIQLLIGLCNCIVKSEAFDSCQSESPFKQIMDTLCNRPSKNQCLSLKEVYSVEQDLRKLSGGKFALSTPICKTEVPVFRGSTWFQCDKGHVYSRFTAVDVDIFHKIQDSCPQCAGLKDGDYYVIGM